MKRFLTLFFAIVLAVSFGANNALKSYASEPTVDTKVMDAVQGNPVICDSVLLLDNGYVCLTISSDESDDSTPFGYTEREKSKSFTHQILDKDGVVLANFSTVVYGVYSYADNYARITSVSGNYSNAIITGLSYSVSYNGDTATVSIKLNGVTIGHIYYRLYTNGSLVEV